MHSSVLCCWTWIHFEKDYFNSFFNGNSFFPSHNKLLIKWLLLMQTTVCTQFKWALHIHPSPKQANVHIFMRSMFESTKRPKNYIIGSWKSSRKLRIIVRNIWRPKAILVQSWMTTYLTTVRWSGSLGPVAMTTWVKTFWYSSSSAPGMVSCSCFFSAEPNFGKNVSK